MAAKCFVPDCDRDAIGQCAGLQGQPCGHSFCSIHSKGEHCDECAAMLEHGKLFSEYMNAAEKVGSSMWLSGWFFLLLIPVAFIPQFLNEQFHSRAVYIFSTAVLLLLAYGSNWLIHKKRLKKACLARKRFDEFYKAYRSLRKTGIFETMMVTADIAADTVVMATGDMPCDDESARRDIDRIRNRLYRKISPGP